VAGIVGCVMQRIVVSKDDTVENHPGKEYCGR
jgi:hypothetical protein